MEKSHRRKERVLSMDDKSKGKHSNKHSSKTPVFTSNKRQLARPSFLGIVYRNFQGSLLFSQEEL